MHTMFPARARTPDGTIEPARAYLDPRPDGTATLVVLAVGPGREVGRVRRKTISAPIAVEVLPGAWEIDRNVWSVDLPGGTVVVETGSGCGCGHPLKSFRLAPDERAALVEEVVA